MFDGKSVFLEGEDPAHETGGGAATHRVAHGVEPSEGTVVYDELELAAPEVLMRPLICGHVPSCGAVLYCIKATVRWSPVSVEI